MIKLRKILLYNSLYFLILTIVLIITLIRINYKYTSIYSENIKKVEGIVNEINIDGNKLKIELKSKENIIGTYYFKTKKEKEYISENIALGDKLILDGSLSKVKDVKTKELFNYKKYLERQKIYYTISIDKIYLIEKNTNIFYFIKNKVIKRCINPYIKTFILGDTSMIDSNILSNYRDIGISHLFAISGMHITLLSSILLKLLKKMNIMENQRYLVVSILLLFYLFLTGITPSVLRAVLFFLFFSINKIYYFHIKSTNIFILTVAISLLINPYYIFEVSFQYSFSISFALIVLGDFINKYSNYFIKLLITSLISFIVSIPITLLNFNQLNFLSIIYNIFYVPLISIIVFPLSLICFFIPVLTKLLNIFIFILEETSIFFNQINITKLIFKNINLYYYFLYVIFIIVFFYGLLKNKKYLTLFLIILIFIHYLLPSINNYPYFLAIDVGQGDSMFIHIKNKNILIDTGGIESFSNKKWQQQNNKYQIVKNVTIPLIKKRGVKKIDYLILTHGDFDHMGEVINLVNNFKVENVIFNCGEYNELENELIKVLDKKKIPYYSCIKELNIEDNKLYFLNNGTYDNENDNSSVIYTELNNYKFLFMGDAGVEVEEDLIEKYNLQEIDVLKVGHHGSRTSSGKEFINEINPKYSIISVGKNNRYGHPNNNVLDNLEDSKIYRTDQDSSIMFKIKNNKLKIETCKP